MNEELIPLIDPASGASPEVREALREAEIATGMTPGQKASQAAWLMGRIAQEIKAGEAARARRRRRLLALGAGSVMAAAAVAAAWLFWTTHEAPTVDGPGMTAHEPDRCDRNRLSVTSFPDCDPPPPPPVPTRSAPAPRAPSP